MKKLFGVLLITFALLIFSPGAYAEEAAPVNPLSVRIDTDTDIMGARLGPALYALASRAGMDIVVNVKSEDVVIARLTGKTVLEAFELLARANNFNWLVQDGAIIVTPAAIGTQTRTFNVPHGDLEYAKKQIATHVPAAKISVNPEYGTISVNGTPLTLSLVDQQLREHLKPVEQIHIQVQMLEISKTEGMNLGLGYSWEAYSGTWPPNYAVTLNAEAVRGKGKLLSRPSITTFNGRQAKISMGEKVPVFSSNAVSGAGTSTSVEYKDVGMFLTVLPRVNEMPDGEKQISLTLKPTVSAITKWITSGQSKAPQIATREAETTVRVPSGGTIIIGGLMKDEDIRNLAGIPGLMDIPILGELFKVRTSSKDKSEVFILVTPTLVGANGKLASAPVLPPVPMPENPNKPKESGS